MTIERALESQGRSAALRTKSEEASEAAVKTIEHSLSRKISELEKHQNGRMDDA